MVSKHLEAYSVGLIGHWSLCWSVLQSQGVACYASWSQRVLIALGRVTVSLVPFPGGTSVITSYCLPFESPWADLCEATEAFREIFLHDP